MHTPAARVWFARNVSAEPYQRIGNGVGVEHRYAQDIVLGLVADGLNVRQR